MVEIYSLSRFVTESPSYSRIELGLRTSIVSFGREGQVAQL